MESSSQENRPPRRACDRCYALKARCERASGSDSGSCARCGRLGLVCLALRAVRPAGRRIQNRALVMSATELKESRVGAWVEHVPILPLEERELLAFLLGHSEDVHCYVACPRFKFEVQQFLSAQLSLALPILKDAYLACASALKQLDPALSIGTDAIIRYASAAMKTLLSLPVSNSQDAILCLTLGAGLAISVSSTIGLGVADICQYCLATAHPFMESAVSRSDTETWQGVLVWLEVMDCLFKRRKPALRIKPQDSKGVDRYLGLCLPLMPYYYDLCIISHSFTYVTDAGVLAFLHRQLDVISTAVEAWTPSPGTDFADQFRASEVVTLLAQARVYRLAALLISHRLRYAFGDQDEQADIWSKEIMMELKVAQKVAGRPNPCVTLPFMVAAIEVRDPEARDEALQNTIKYMSNLSSSIHTTAKAFLCRIWRGRDSRTTSCWLDLAHKPCPVLQSINGTGIT